MNVWWEIATFAKPQNNSVHWKHDNDWCECLNSRTKKIAQQQFVVKMYKRHIQKTSRNINRTLVKT